MGRETVSYGGKNYHRYPESERAHLRNYFYRHDKNKESPVSLHRQVYEDHHGPIPEGMQIHHKNGDFSDNSVENLECLSPRDHRAKHEPSEETRSKLRASAEKRQPLAKWREENPELAKECAKKNGALSTSLAKWREQNPEQVTLAAQAAGRKRAEVRSERGDDVTAGLRKWRAENPEKAAEISRQSGLNNTALDTWRKNNPELARQSLNKWREENPELAREHARAAGKKAAESRARKKAGL